MRTVLILLLLANITLFAYTRLDSFSAGEPARLDGQVEPSKIRILSAQEVAALGPSKVAALADVCMEWGPLTDVERTRALADLAPLNLGSLLAQRRVDIDAWAPTLGPFPSRPQAERRLAEVKGQGVADAALVETAQGGFVLVVGAYRSEALAGVRSDALVAQGIGGARPARRPAPVGAAMIVVRDPSQSVVTRLRELQSAYPGTELKVGACERTS